MVNRKLMFSLMVGLLLVLAVSPFAGYAEEVDWNSPVPMVERVIAPSYQLPTGWQSLVAGVDKISHFNYGALVYDPATVRNGDTFEDLTGVKVEQVVVSFGDMAVKIATTLLSKSPSPDMFQIERNYIRNARAGLLVNVDELWNEELWSHYPDWVRKDIEVDGHYYAVPQLGQQWGFYYRPSLLKEAGFTGLPTTKDELLEMAKATTGEGTYGYGFAAGDNFAAYESFLSILYMQDGRLLHDGKVTLTSEKAKKALQFLVDLVYKYKVVPPSVAELKEAELGDLFVGGKIAMMGQWDYHFARAKNPELSKISEDVGFTVPPSWDKDTKGRALADYEILAINKYSKNIDACKLFLDYMRSEQAHANELIVEGNNSLVKDVFDLAITKRTLDPEYLETHKKLANSSMRENYPHMSEVVDIIGSQVRAAVARAKSVEEALSDAQKEIDKVMQK